MERATPADETPEPGGPDTDRQTTYRLTEADLTGAAKLHYRRHVTSRKGATTLLAIVAACTAVVAAVLAYLNGGLDRESFVLLAIYAVLVVLVLLAVPMAAIWIFGRQGARRTLRQYRALREDSLLRWDERGVTVKSVQGEARIPWGDVWRRAEDERLLLLYQTDRLYFVLPKRALSPAQAGDLLAIVRATVPAGGRPAAAPVNPRSGAA